MEVLFVRSRRKREVTEDLHKQFEKWWSDHTWKNVGEPITVMDVQSGFEEGHRLGREQESKRWEKDVRELEKDARKQFEADRSYIDSLESRMGIGD